MSSAVRFKDTAGRMPHILWPILALLCFNTLLLIRSPTTQCAVQSQPPAVHAASPSSNAVSDQFTDAELDLVRLKRSGCTKPGILALCAGYNEAACRCGLVCKTISEKGFWAPTEASLMEHIWSITPKDRRVMVDVGANIGFFSILGASWGAQVSAFEPRPQPRRLLALSIDVNYAHDRIKVYPFAVGAAESGAKIAADAEWAIGQVQVTGKAKQLGSGSSTTFQVVQLSSYVAGPITILKVDTEGFEASVFEGAYDLLDHVQYVIVEVKEFDKPEKRTLLYNILSKGQFKYVYNYEELYGSPVYPTVNNKFVDVTDVVRSQDVGKSFKWEDFVFARKPVDPLLRIQSSV